MRKSESRSSRRRIAAIAIITTILVGGGGAATYAYWSAAGGGTGSVSATTTPTPLVVAQTVTISNLVPGGPAQTLGGTITNPASNSGPIYANVLTATLQSVTKSGSAPSGTCTTNDFSLVATPISIAREITPNTSITWSGFTVQMLDNTTASQDACKGATVTISYAIS